VLDGPCYRPIHSAQGTVVGLPQESRGGSIPPHELLGSLSSTEVQGVPNAVIAIGNAEIPLKEFCDVGLYFGGGPSESQALLSHGIAPICRVIQRSPSNASRNSHDRTSKRYCGELVNLSDDPDVGPFVGRPRASSRIRDEADKCGCHILNTLETISSDRSAI